MSLYFSKFFYTESHLIPIKTTEAFKEENMTPLLLQMEKERQVEEFGRELYLGCGSMKENVT